MNKLIEKDIIQRGMHVCWTRIG